MKISISLEIVNKRMGVINREESTLVLAQKDLSIEHGDEVLSFMSGQMLYTPVNGQCYLISDLPVEVIIVHIPENIINAREELFFSSFNLFDLDEKLEYIKAILFLELGEGTEQKILEPLFIYLYSKLKDEMTSASATYIQQCYSEKIEVEYLAQLENYSVNYFYKWFRLKYNDSPTAYIRKVRINRAKELLLTTDFSMTDIAKQVGFTQLSSFTRSFKNTVGISPLTYRDRYR